MAQVVEIRPHGRPVSCIQGIHGMSPRILQTRAYPDSKAHGANMGPTWVLSAPDGPHVGPMNLAIRVLLHRWPVSEADTSWKFLAH